MKEGGEHGNESRQVWMRLEANLSELLRRKVKLIFPSKWNKTYHNWYETLEREAFREELRYSPEEILERIDKPDLLVFFVVSEQRPLAVLLSYTMEEEWAKTLYVDTIAVREQGKGIGRAIMNAIIEWGRLKNYRAIVLDTEEQNEKGLPLRKFYEGLGFVLDDSDDHGNLTMMLRLRSETQS
jgi:GNAT superfamily N-acetyltransferase